MKEIHKLVEDDAESTNQVCQQLSVIYNDLLKKKSPNNNIEDASAKADEDDYSVNFVLPFSGREQSRTNKRHRSAYKK
jgi:hypothetical protein